MEVILTSPVYRLRQEIASFSWHNHVYYGNQYGVESYAILSTSNRIYQERVSYGNAGEVKLTPQDSKILAYATKEMMILIHNHNNLSSFSAIDVKLFMKYESIKTMVAVDSSGKLYIIEKTSATSGNATWYFATKVKGIQDQLDKNKEYTKLSVKRKDEIFIQSTHSKTKQILNEKGIDYGAY